MRRKTEWIFQFWDEGPAGLGLWRDTQPYPPKKMNKRDALRHMRTLKKNWFKYSMRLIRREEKIIDQYTKDKALPNE